MLQQIWQVLAGVAIFMLGMRLLAESLRTLAGRGAKLYLKKQTGRPLSAIVGGTVITGLVQSSSVVNLIVLGFVGAGIIPMANALAITLGTNIGTTLNTWILATIGFKLEIETLALPAIAIAGILKEAFPTRYKFNNWLGFLLGLGFLFYGLGMMRIGMEHSISKMDFAAFSDLPGIVYVIAGLTVTVLTQSSAATNAIVLSVLNAGIVNLHTAMLIMLGSEVGTTIKLVIAAAGKEAAMKRVAFGNFIFNLVTITVVFIFLKQINYFIVKTIAITDPLVSLAFFQTMINLLAVILFFPVLGPLARFLEKRFDNKGQTTRYINKVPAPNIDLAIDALEQETICFLKEVIQYCLNVFDKDDMEILNEEISKGFTELNCEGRYQFIKHLHGDMYAYYTEVQSASENPEQILQLEQLMASVRNGMYAAKSMKDAIIDIEQLRNSGDDIKYQFYIQARETAAHLLEQLALPLQSTERDVNFSILVEIYQQIRTGYNDRLSNLYKKALVPQLSEVEISTIINFNREVYTAFKSLVLALKDVCLSRTEAKYFDDLPGFIH